LLGIENLTIAMALLQGGNCVFEDHLPVNPTEKAISKVNSTKAKALTGRGSEFVIELVVPMNTRRDVRARHTSGQ